MTGPLVACQLASLVQGLRHLAIHDAELSDHMRVAIIRPLALSRTTTVGRNTEPSKVFDE